MSILLAQYNFKVNKPIIPPLVHDDTTRLIVCAGLIVVFSFILYRTMRHFNEL
jgi:hypothetical protein